MHEPTNRHEESRDQANMVAVDAYLREAARSVYAGSYFCAEDGLTYVGFTAEPERHEAALRARIDQPSSLRTFVATWTLVELEQILDSVVSDPALERAVNWGATIDVPTNRVTLLVPEPIHLAARNLVAEHGGAVILETGTVEPASGRPRDTAEPG